MGIKNLHKFLKKHAENAYVEKHLSHYAYKKIAIDTSLYMYKYKIIYGNKWLNAFVNLVVTLREHDIHCIFIYDNGCPAEKIKEREKRADSREKIEKRAHDIEVELDSYELNGEISENLKKIYDSLNDKKLSLLLPNKNTGFNITIIKRELDKLKSQIVKILPEDFALTKKLFEIMGIPYQNATLEAEKTCAQLCVEGKVDAVLTEDTDVLAYNTPLFLTKLNLSNNTITELDINCILESINFTFSQFQDLCIMCGTDYNQNIPKVGSENAYKLLTMHGNIDEIAKNTDKDITILNHVRVRELFSFDAIIDFEVPYCDTPDFSKLETFLFTYNCKTDINRIKKSTTTELIFE